MSISTKFRAKYGESHLYSRIWAKGLKTKLKDGTVVTWHDKKIIQRWMANYMRVRDEKRTANLSTDA